MPTNLHDFALLIIAPALAVIVATLWLVLLAKRKGTMNLSLKFLGLTLEVKSCSLTERQCLAARRMDAEK